MSLRRFALNPAASRSPYQPLEGSIVSHASALKAKSAIAAWDGYAPTPLLDLEGLARDLGVARILYKDESGRFGQGSFKVLGGAYAAGIKLGAHPDPGRATLCCATDGNHGRSVALAARRFGARCVVFMHEEAPDAKAAAIAALGAEIVRVPGTYDYAVRAACAASGARGWMLIQDTSDDPADETTRHVMQGYTVMVLEIMEQLERNTLPTHVFLQGGVGGFAGAVAGALSERLGELRPRMIVVEPETAACLYESAARGAPTRISGDLRTTMEMLSAGEASAVAWPILERRADAFLTVDDDGAAAAARRLQTPAPPDPTVDVGLSGAAGLAGLMALIDRPDLAHKLELGASATVLLFGTEGGPKAG